jgi:hypothetical protein
VQLTALSLGSVRVQPPQTLSPPPCSHLQRIFVCVFRSGVLFHFGDERFLQAAWGWIGISTMSQNSVFETSETRLGHSLGHQGWGGPQEDEALLLSRSWSS